MLLAVNWEFLGLNWEFYGLNPLFLVVVLKKNLNRLVLILFKFYINPF